MEKYIQNTESATGFDYPHTREFAQGYEAGYKRGRDDERKFTLTTLEESAKGSVVGNEYVNLKVIRALLAD